MSGSGTCSGRFWAPGLMGWTVNSRVKHCGVALATGDTMGGFMARRDHMTQRQDGGRGPGFFCVRLKLLPSLFVKQTHLEAL